MIHNFDCVSSPLHQDITVLVGSNDHLHLPVWCITSVKTDLFCQSLVNWIILCVLWLGNKWMFQSNWWPKFSAPVKHISWCVSRTCQYWKLEACWAAGTGGTLDWNELHHFNDCLFVEVLAGCLECNPHWYAVSFTYCAVTAFWNVCWVCALLTHLLSLACRLCLV